mgnify:CR=1 FL=1
MKDQILKLRREGKTYNEIKEITGCSKSTISYYCSRIEENNDLKVKNEAIKNIESVKYLNISREVILKIIELRENKLGYDEISNELSINKVLISKICRSFNLLHSRRNGKITTETIKKIKELYNEHKNIRKVSKLLNISRESVRKFADIQKIEKLTDEELKSNRVQSVISWRKRVKLKLIEYKGGKCERCNYNRCERALEFHHLDPSKKDFTISGKSWSYERLKIEVDKCILVCSNCHNEIHYELEKSASTSPS